jgi:signal transduction histidine kinase
MKKLTLIISICLLVVTGISCCEANDATVAQSLVNDAINMFEKEGNQLALAAINMDKGPFVAGDIYVFAVTLDNVVVAHPLDHSIRGMSVGNVIDVSGTPIFRRFSDTVTKDGSGWVDYMWVKPGGDRPVAKRSFVKIVPGTKIYVGAGYYMP